MRWGEALPEVDKMLVQVIHRVFGFDEFWLLGSLFSGFGFRISVFSLRSSNYGLRILVFECHFSPAPS